MNSIIMSATAGSSWANGRSGYIYNNGTGGGSGDFFLWDCDF